jgi:calcineurin-like phosphoesterase family protein
MATYLTADFHLGDNRFDILGRPFFDYYQEIKTLESNFNEIITKNDELIFVGDYIYKDNVKYIADISWINGKKILIKGNHDTLSDDLYKKYFDEIIPNGGGIERKIGGIDCYITHYPTQGKQHLFNLVGHIHAAWKVQLNMLNIGIDVWHYKPVSEENVKFMFNAINKFYDADVWVGENPINTIYKDLRGKKTRYFNE